MNGIKIWARFSHSAVAEKIKMASRILVMTGAGLSTPSGIPDFRTPGSGNYEFRKICHISRSSAKAATIFYSFFSMLSVWLSLLEI